MTEPRSFRARTGIGLAPDDDPLKRLVFTLTGSTPSRGAQTAVTVHGLLFTQMPSDAAASRADRLSVIEGRVSKAREARSNDVSPKIIARWVERFGVRSARGLLGFEIVSIP